jgi:DNA helicase-2/ATP-dependent DNA helicase PcrA
MNLTAEQRAAVECDDDVVLTACPGSGKTRAIAARLTREIDRLRGSPRAAACITYTNAAVQEVEQRIAGLLLDDDEHHYVIARSIPSA